MYSLWNQIFIFTNQSFNFIFCEQNNMKFIGTHKYITKPFVNNIPFITFSGRKITFSAPARFLMKGFVPIFLHDKIDAGVSQRRPKLIWNTKLYVYPYINFMNTGIPIVQKLDVRCNLS